MGRKIDEEVGRENAILTKEGEERKKMRLYLGTSRKNNEIKKERKRNN